VIAVNPDNGEKAMALRENYLWGVVHYRSPTKENTSDVLLSVLKTVDPTATEVGKDQGYSNTECKAITA
jgi:hypothetical protein